MCVLLREEGVEIGRDGVCLSYVTGVIFMRFFSCVGGFGCSMGLIGKLPNEVGYGCF